MNSSDLILHRLNNQQIAKTNFQKPEEIVYWMGAMQAQEYAMAKWAIGLRLDGVGHAEVEAAFDRGDILRTHVMRPTWHFVAPADIRWLLALTAPHVKRINSYYYRKWGLDRKIFRKAHRTIAKALEGDRHLTRSKLKIELERAGITGDSLRMAGIFMEAELDALICSGASQRESVYLCVGR